MYLKKLTQVMLASLISVSPTIWALELPSGNRAPNLSLDPFERARKAVQNLPPPQQPAPAPAPAQPQQPAAVPAPQQPVFSSAPAPVPAQTTVVSEPGERFSQEITGIVDWFAKTAGGIQEPVTGADPAAEQGAGSSATLALVGYAAEVSTDAAGLWKNGRFFLNASYSMGAGIGESTGDFHGVSNIDAGDTAAKLLELGYEHSFAHSNSSLLVGLFDWNGEFHVSEYSGLFLNGAPGMGTVVAEGGGAPAFPQTAVGLRYKVDLTPSIYMMVSAQDASPGEETDLADFSISKRDGVFGAVELGMTRGEPGSSEGYYKLALGNWYTTVPVYGFTGAETGEEHPDQATLIDANEGAVRPDNAGLYLIGETSIGETLGLFGKVGMASPEMNRYSRFYLAGLNYTGLIPGRADDVTGLAVMITQQSPVFLELNPGDPTRLGFFSKEVVYELTYSTQITDWLMVQPDLQYILQPGMNANIGDATVIGMRAQVTF